MLTSRWKVFYFFKEKIELDLEYLDNFIQLYLFDSYLNFFVVI